ncbi:MAG: putative sulfate/molybdate transporter [Thiohalophilus sp.]
MSRMKFDRMELAGSLGDLGTLLPIAVAMVVINGLDPLGLFLSIGVFYVAAGLYFGITVPVQPMKVIGAYAIATGMSAEQILASSFLMGVLLLIIGVTGAIDLIRKITQKAVIRGVQLATGALLIASGIKFIIGTSRLQMLQQAAEPYLTVQAIGPVPVGLVLGGIGGLFTLLLLDNRKIPAGLVIVLGGFVLGLTFGAPIEAGSIGLALALPEVLPFGFPTSADFSFALFALVLPQLPMTLGNAILAYTDLSREYFGKLSARLTNRSACVSMALANFFSFLLGGMPLCHGAGGLAAHYRFGARTAGSNLMIGLIFAALALLFGHHIVNILNLLPMSILGVLLVFAGSQLTLSIIDLDSRKDYFVATLILGVTLASNLAAGFIVGIVIAQLLRWKRLSV